MLASAIVVTSSAAISVAFAQLVGTALVSDAEPRMRAMALAGALITTGLTFGPEIRPRGVGAFYRALAWSALLALGAALLALANGALSIGPSLVGSVACAVGILTLATCGLELWLSARGARAADAKLTVAASMALIALGPVWLGPLAEVSGGGRVFIDVIVAMSPLTFIAELTGVDYLRTPWFYTHSPVGSLRFDLPGIWRACFMWIGVGLIPFVASWHISKSRS